MQDRATLLDFKLNDGTTIQMTLSFGRLYKLRQKNEAAYKKYNQLTMDGMKDEFDFVAYLYTAYLCANVDELDKCMTEEEFIEKMPDNHLAVAMTVNRLKIVDKKNRIPRTFLKEETQKNNTDT